MKSKYKHLILSISILIPVCIWQDMQNGIRTLFNFYDYIKQWLAYLTIAAILSLAFYTLFFLLRKKPDFIVYSYRSAYAISIISIFGLVMDYIFPEPKNNVQTLKELSFNKINKYGKNDVHLDTQNNIYSNYTYAVSVDLPDYWIVDGGVSKNTIYRSYDQDSAITFSINVIPNENAGLSTVWEILDSDERKYRNQIISGFNKQTNSKVEGLVIRKSFIKNHKSIRHYFEMDLRQRDYDIKFSTIQYQTLRNNSIYTFSLSMPTKLYTSSSEFYESYFDRVNFLSLN